MFRPVLVAALVVLAVSYSANASPVKRDISDLFQKITDLAQKVVSKIKDDLKSITDKLGSLGQRIKDATEFLHGKLKELTDEGVSALPKLRDDLLTGVNELLSTVQEARENPNLFLVEKVQLDIVITWLKLIEKAIHLIPGTAGTDAY